MAVRRTVRRTESFDASEYETPMMQQPMYMQQPAKPWLEKIAPVLLVVVVGMSFALGSMWSKMKYLEEAAKNGAPAAGAAANNGQAAATGKYKTLTEAVKDLGGKAGLDTNKLVSCMNSGSKAEIVQKDYDEGGKVGVQGTPGFFINGKFLGGAFPFESFKELIDRELDGTGSKNYKDYKNSALVGAGEQQIFKAEPQNINLGSAAAQGGSNAKVTIVEFSDFQCPYCQRGYETLNQIKQAYGDRVKIVFKHFPLSQIHPLAQKASEAFECAREQGDDKAWKFHDQLFEAQRDWSPATGV